jgi:hypothetical protein
MRIQVFFTYLFIWLLSGPDISHAQQAQITIHSDEILEKSYIGNGVQWSAYPSRDIPEPSWQKTFERLDFMKLNFIRLMVSAEDYCITYPAGGKPEFTWNSDKMKRVYRILDYCEKNNVTVLLGDWSDPAGRTKEINPSKRSLRFDGIQEYDPRWTEIVTTLISHLVHEKKYTCIQYFNLGNEPNGDWMHNESFDTWKQSILNLDKELKKQGHRERIKIVGPDCAWGNTWIKQIIADQELMNAMDAYEVHWYAKDTEIEEAEFEKEISYYRTYINEHDPKGSSKPFFMGEVGMVTGKNDHDQQTLIHTFQYGVWMADFVIQSMRAGQAGTIAWDLDDAMHTSGYIGPGNGVNDYNWKVWGFWDSFGSMKGKPELEDLRPWYYTWSLLSKFVPAKSQVLKTQQEAADGLRSTAIKFEKNGHTYYTIAIVNAKEEAVDIKLKFNGLKNTAEDFYRYHYFENDRPTDDKGFPVVKQVIKKLKLNRGMQIKMPGKGVVIITSMQ